MNYRFSFPQVLVIIIVSAIASTTVTYLVTPKPPVGPQSPVQKAIADYNSCTRSAPDSMAEMGCQKILDPSDPI